MAKGTLLVSNVVPLKRIVEECQCGLVFEAGNELDLAEKIMQLINNEKLRNELGQNGSACATNKYNWENTSKELIQTYNSL